MRRLLVSALWVLAVLFAFLCVEAWFAPASRALMSGVAYTDFANIFSANQRINAGLGVNVAPGATGTLSLSDGIFERSRAFKAGEWQSVTFSSGNYTSSAGSTWTVTAPEQIAFSYTVVGKTMFMVITLDSTSITGTPPQRLRVAIPGGFTSAATALIPVRVNDNGTARLSVAEVDAGVTTIIFYADETTANTWALSTSNTAIGATLTFAVQ